MQAEKIELPSFRMAYNGNAGSDLHGKMFPPGQIALVITENRLHGSISNRFQATEYCKLVPPHDNGSPMRLCLICEVVYTAVCKMGHEKMHSPANVANQGAYFDWPDTEGMATCPGTGEHIKPDRKRMHLLAVHEIHGSRRSGTEEHYVSRFIPRILTLEGYERLMGGTSADAANRCITATSGNRVQMYPELFRLMTTGRPKQRAPKHPKPVGFAWGEFHDSGRFLAYERYCMDNYKEMAKTGGQLGLMRMKFSGSTKGRDFED
jgi:hypothetical protein